MITIRKMQLQIIKGVQPIIEFPRLDKGQAKRRVETCLI